MNGFIRHLSNHRGFTLLEILLAVGLLLGAVVYLTRIFYGVGSISADSRLQMEQIIIAQSAMEIVVAGILDKDNLPIFKGDDFFAANNPQEVGIVGDDLLVGESGIEVKVQIERSNNPNPDLKNFTIEVVAKHPRSRDFKLVHHLLGV